jgi:hypothetical protein
MIFYSTQAHLTFERRFRHTQTQNHTAHHQQLVIVICRVRHPIFTGRFLKEFFPFLCLEFLACTTKLRVLIKVETVKNIRIVDSVQKNETIKLKRKIRENKRGKTVGQIFHAQIHILIFVVVSDLFLQLLRHHHGQKKLRRHVGEVVVVVNQGHTEMFSWKRHVDQRLRLLLLFLRPEPTDEIPPRLILRFLRRFTYVFRLRALFLIAPAMTAGGNVEIPGEKPRTPGAIMKTV